MSIVKSSMSRYDLKKDHGNIFVQDKALADFVNSKWPPTLSSKMAAKVSGHFESL